jgi:hypothetical protein
MEIEIFEIESGRWAYRVGGVYQEWHPDREGFMPMTEAEATQQAQIVAARMQG